MAAKELYDYLSTVTPDYSLSTLSVSPQGNVAEESSKDCAIHIGSDGSEERVSFGSSSIFHLTVNWNILSEDDSTTIFDFYNDSSKANGKNRSFKFTYGDGHTYVVRFDCTLPRVGPKSTMYRFQGVRLRVLGRVAD
jgi:hypothetical protein